MQQEGDDGRGGGDGDGGGVTGNQDRRLKGVQGGDGQVQQQRQQPQPQKCPRCESSNTKFCYYNNYSLSQPRYFCKTCRRYWTQGGTLRNVPVGGGCRKGKRARTAASSSTTTAGTSSRSLQLPQEVVVQSQPGRPDNIISSDHPDLRATKDLYAALVSPPPAPASVISHYYQGTADGGGGGYLSSLAAIQLNPSQPSFNQGLNIGTDAVGSSNLGLLSGFNVASLGSQRQIPPPSQFFQMGNREREMEALFPAEQRGLIQSTMTNNGVSHHDWSQSFITNATNHRGPADASLWSPISTSSISGNSESNANSGSSSLIPNQWPDLPGYGPPP